jgi:hypothetical protein
MRFEVYVVYGFLLYNTIQYGRIRYLQDYKKSCGEISNLWREIICESTLE